MDQRTPLLDPAVSVIISTYNCRVWLAEALDALAAQTLPSERLEILVTDDGSTDGSWDDLQARSRRVSNLRIFRQEHTGGPSAGRNRALREARGTYVFFHDADDYLAPDALFRLFAAAVTNDADVVVGQVAWVNHPGVRPRLLPTLDDADLLAAGIWRSLTPHKLVRRTLVDRLDLRFCEDMAQGEDQVFMAHCLFAANKISLVGGRPCYFRRLREDGSNLSRQPQTLEGKARTCSRMVAVVVANTVPGERRDALLRRVFVRTLVPALHRPFVQASPDLREAFLHQLQADVFPHLPPQIPAGLGDHARLRLLTARVGTAANLLEANQRLARARLCPNQELPTFDLGPRLNRLLSAADRRVGGTALSVAPLLHTVTRSGGWLNLEIEIHDEIGGGALHLAARRRDGASVVDFGRGQDGGGPTSSFRLDLDRLQPSDPPRIPEDECPPSEWILMLQRHGRRANPATSPVGWGPDLGGLARVLPGRPWQCGLAITRTADGSVSLSVWRGSVGSWLRYRLAASRAAHTASVRSHRVGLWWLAVAVGLAASGIRLAAVLRGGGLFGVGNYDDGVYYAAAAGLVHGRLPYRDFLLLHPPGVALLLAPFVAAAGTLGDSIGFGAARLAWILLGGVNAVLVWQLGRRIGAVAAALGAAWYAVSFPAVYSEHTTLLEAPATTALLLACLLLQQGPGGRPRSPAWAFGAGGLLGVGAGIKIWGVVPLVLVVGYLLVVRRVREAAVGLAGAAVTGAAVCVPFFAAAPRQMWDQVVRDQLSRPPGGTPPLDRLAGIAGLPSVAGPLSTPVTYLAVAVLVGLLALAFTVPAARLWVVLTVGLTAFLLSTPTWFLHYAALTAAPIALSVGAASQRLWAFARRRRAPRVAGVVGVTALASLIVAQAGVTGTATFGEAFPARALEPAVQGASGCITADDPLALIETDTLDRNLRRGCPLVADVGGTSHDLRAAAGAHETRTRNLAFQQWALDYLGSGSRTILMRFPGHGFSRCTTSALHRWPLLARSGSYEVRRPQPTRQQRCGTQAR